MFVFGGNFHDIRVRRLSKSLRKNLYIMETGTVDLYEYFKRERHGAKGGYLAVYARAASSEIAPKYRPAMLVVPGGGYEILSDREGEPVALRFMSEGYASFVLYYSVHTAYPVPLDEACMAMAYIRQNAERYCIDKTHVGVTGFSAAGHLTGLLATVSDEEADRVSLKSESVRPDAVILSYPVITMTDGLTHDGTKRVISGDGKIDCDRLSVEKRVTNNSAPAFVWHTYEDACVPVENSLMLASAYRKADVPFNLHIFENGSHGLSLCNEETSNMTADDIAVSYVGKWIELALDWLISRGFAVTSRII